VQQFSTISRLTSFRTDAFYEWGGLGLACMSVVEDVLTVVALSLSLELADERKGCWHDPGSERTWWTNASGKFDTRMRTSVRPVSNATGKG